MDTGQPNPTYELTQILDAARERRVGSQNYRQLARWETGSGHGRSGVCMLPMFRWMSRFLSGLDQRWTRVGSIHGSGWPVSISAPLQTDIRTSTGAFGCKLHFFLTYYLSHLVSYNTWTVACNQRAYNLLFVAASSVSLLSVMYACISRLYTPLTCPVTWYLFSYLLPLSRWVLDLLSSAFRILPLSFQSLFWPYSILLPVSLASCHLSPVYLYQYRTCYLYCFSPTTSPICRRGRSSSSPSKEPVSYTHLTLPTILRV